MKYGRKVRSSVTLQLLNDICPQLNVPAMSGKLQNIWLSLQLSSEFVSAVNQLSQRDGTLHQMVRREDKFLWVLYLLPQLRNIIHYGFNLGVDFLEFLLEGFHNQF